MTIIADGCPGIQWTIVDLVDEHIGDWVVPYTINLPSIEDTLVGGLIAATSLSPKTSKVTLDGTRARTSKHPRNNYAKWDRIH